MVLPNKKIPFTKEEEQLKNKLKKLFKDEDFNVKPANAGRRVNQKVKTVSAGFSSTNIKKNNEKTDTKKNKRKCPIINSPQKKVKTERKSYYETKSATESDDYSEYTNDSFSDDQDRSYCESSSEDNDRFKKLATKTLRKEEKKNQAKLIKSKNLCCVFKNSNSKSKQILKNTSKNFSGAIIDTSDTDDDFGDDLRGKSKINSHKRNNQSEWKSESVQGESKSDQQYQRAHLSSKIVNNSKFVKLNGNVKIEPKKIEKVVNCKSRNKKKEKKSPEIANNEQFEKLNGNIKIEHKLHVKEVNCVDNKPKYIKIEKRTPEKTFEKHKEKTDSHIKNNINKKLENNSIKNKKLKETDIIARKIKENNQKLVPYNSSNTNYNEEEDVDEMMRFYGIESTDDDEDGDFIDEEDDNLFSDDFGTKGEEDSYNADYDSEEDVYDSEEEGDYDSDEEDKYNSGEEEYYDSEYTSAEDYESSYNDYNFDEESNDTDYNLPENCEEDLYIPQGNATTYNIAGYDIKFDSENEAQIIEIPTENSIKINKINVLKEEPLNKDYESDNSCPQLVPITNETQFIDTENNYDLTNSESEYSDCCSEYTEETEGSLCFLENPNDIRPQEATIMTPEIINLSCVNLQNHNLIINQLENFNSVNEIEIILDKDNPLEKVINKSANISNTSISYKITTAGNAKIKSISKNTNKKSLPKLLTINNQISSEFDKELNLGKFETKLYNAIDSCHVLVLLRDPIYIYGTLKIKLIAGNIEIFGYKPDLNETLEIFSPRGYSFLDIKSIKLKKITQEQNNLLNLISNYENIFLKHDLNDIVANFNVKTDALIILTRNDCNKKIEMLRKYMKENLLPNMNSITLDRRFYASEFILHCLIRIESNNSIHIDPKWQTIKLNSNTKSMIIGGKSVGKSTLLRYLINNNLKIFKKILLIDLDIGQPELFIPQTINVYILEQPLLGPGYYLGLEPKKSLLFGDINVILSPIDYLKNIQYLLKYCQDEEEFQNIPWFINTMGYVKGFGNELIASVIKYLQPTDIIQLQSSKLANNFDYLMYPNIVKTIPMNVYAENDLNVDNDIVLKHHLILFDSIMNGRQTVKATEWDMKSKDMRYAMIVTRLGAALNKYDWLSDVKPVCTPIDDIEIINFGEDYLTKEELLDVINANLVYLCNKSVNNHIYCYGLGIIRGIDRFQRKIYLLPAVPLKILENVNCFAICNIPLPTSILLNQGPKVKGIVPYAYNTNKVIASKSVHQIYNRGQKKKMRI